MSDGIAIVYMGDASTEDSECPQAVKVALAGRFETVFAGDACEMDVVTALRTLNPSLYVQPGGGDDMGVAWAAVGPNKEALCDWIRNGGKYLGICMGAFLSGQGGDDDDFKGYELITEAGWDTSDYIETEGADVSDMDQTLVTVEWEGASKKIFFQGGPSFVPLEEGVEPSGEVVARYSNGDAAAIVVPFGAGMIAVTGPHPEAVESWYDDVANEGGPRGAVVHDLLHQLIDKLYE